MIFLISFHYVLYDYFFDGYFFSKESSCKGNRDIKSLTKKIGAL